MLIDELEKQETIIILDANVLLKAYDYQPEMIDFCLKCLYKIEEYILLPSIVCSEYESHYQEKYGSIKNKYIKMRRKCIEPLNKFNDSIIKVLEHEKDEKQLDEVEDLGIELKKHINAIEEIINDFINKYDNDNSIVLSINNEDRIKKFYDNLLKENKLLNGFSQLEIYKICLEGEKRYSKKIPPGFEDIKKGGLRQYSDFILWKEIIKCSKDNNKNIIFISNDIKKDWRVRETNELLSYLKNEFENETNRTIECYTSKEFFGYISKIFGVPKSEHISLMIDITNEIYCKRISDKVYESIQDEIENYIIDNNDSNNIGSEGLEDICIDEYEYEGYNEVNYFDNEIEYFLMFSVKAHGTSKDYWSRDDDGDIIYSPDKQHYFDGTIEVVVYRTKSDIEDVGTDDNFNSARISAAYFEETKYISEFDYKGSIEHALGNYHKLIKD